MSAIRWVHWLMLAASLTSGCETPEERGARENAELEAKLARRRKREAKADARRQEVAEDLGSTPSKTAVQQPAAEPTARPEELQSVYSRMSAAERATAMREACPAGCDLAKRKAIVAAAPSAERAALDGLADRLIAEHDARERAREAQERAQRNAGRVCCCDGTASPSCTTVHRGCCSRHGGVCACR
ncbi:hypothetical protein [Sorangium sp. So ce1000]|uniref:hypothetical protein n=1 Tax=Sorangium sp. So ce1000 TaxID=3133325 RepID=UPI003F6484B5